MKNLHSSRLIHCAGLLMVALLWLANSSNPPTGRTGAPFDGSCADCHSGGSFNGNVSITGMPGTVMPNTVYPLQITLDATTGSPSKGGFQLVAVDGSNANSGNLAAANAQTGTEMSGGREYIEHRGAKTFGGNPITWDFNWTSPISAAGNTIKFYFIGNFTNGNGGITGDSPIALSETYTFLGQPPVTANILAGANVTCNGDSDGTATVAASGGQQPYSYLWNNGQTTQTAVNLAAGTYTVVVTGVNGSGTASATAVIGQPAAIVANVNIGGALSCSQTSVSVTATTSGGTGPYTYAWSNGSTGNSTSYTVGGAQNVLITDDNGCTKVVLFNIQDSSNSPNITATGGTLTCTQPATIIQANSSTSGAIFSWIGPGGFTSNQQNPTISLPGTYTVTVTNPANACTNTATAVVTQNITPPSATATPGGSLTCTTTSVPVMSATNAPNAIFSWSGPNGFIAATQNIAVQVPGNYTVTITSTVTGCTAAAVATVVQNIAPPTVSVAPAGPLTCTTTMIPVTTTTNAPNATFSWIGPGGFTANTQNISAQVLGNYTIAITSTANGCTASAVATVTQNTTPPTVSIATPGVLDCSHTTVQLNALASSQGNFTYQWTTANGNIVTGGTTLNPTVNTAGTYNLLITNTQNGCTATSMVTVTQSPAEVATIASTVPVTCNGGTNGSATAQATGGTGGYTYLWSNGTTAATAANLPVGNYTVTITSANNCTATATAIITQPAVLAANATATAQTTNSVNDGHAMAAPSGGTSGYTYLWSNSATTAQITGLAPGNYTVTITDARGCTAAQTVTVNAFNCALVTSVTTTHATCPESADGSATILVGGGTVPYGYTWSSGDSIVTATGLATGTYTVSVTDAAGCSITATATIIAVDTIVPALACPGNIFLCGADLVNYTLPVISDNCNLNGSLPTLVSGQASGTAFNDGVTTQVFSAADAAGNTATCSFTITIFSIPDILVDSVQNDLGNSSSGSIHVTAVGGVGPYVFIWEKDGVFFSNEEDLTGLPTGNYRLVITDANGCGGALAPVFIDNVVGTANPPVQTSIRVWPNPAQTGIWVKMNDLTVFSAEILNSQGRLVQTITPAGLTDFLSVAHLPNGIYYLKVVDEAGKTWVVKWVKGE